MNACFGGGLSNDSFSFLVHILKNLQVVHTTNYLFGEGSGCGGGRWKNENSIINKFSITALICKRNYRGLN